MIGIKIETQGFSIIEISVALFISSLLTLMLYQSFNNTQKTSLVISATMNAERAFSIAYNQLEKDISAIFVPERVFAQMTSQKTESPTKKGSDEKTEEKSFKDLFSTTEKENNLEILSFLSTHSLPLYSSKSPYAVRIVYRLEKQEAGNFYKLARQESPQLDLPIAQFKEKNIRAYELMNNIKSLTIRFTVSEKQSKNTEQKNEKSASKKYVPLTTWPTTDDTKKPTYLIPAYITLQGIFVDAVTEREYPFEWIFPVFVYDDVMLRLETITEKDTSKKQENNDKKTDSQQKNSSQEKQSTKQQTRSSKLDKK